MQRVTSRHNPRLREAARLIASSRDRRKAGKCVLEGEHLVAAYTARHGAPETVIVTDDALSRSEVRALVERHSERTLIVPDALFGELATLPAGVGLLAVVATPAGSVASSPKSVAGTTSVRSAWCAASARTAGRASASSVTISVSGAPPRAA